MRIIIFGASNTGKKAFELLETQYEVIAFCDNNIELIGKELFGIPILSPESILDVQNDFIVIASIFHMDIVKQLYVLGIKNVKLFQMRMDEKGYLLLELNGGEPFKSIVPKKIEMPTYRNRDKKNQLFTKKKKVLIIAYFFPPAGGSPVQRTLKFVKYLRENGYEPVVLTTEIDSNLNKYSLDYSLLSDIPDGVQIIRMKDDYAYPDVILKEKAQEIVDFLYSISDSREWIDRFIEAQKTQSAYILPDKFILWANECIRHIDECIDMQEIDLIYSTVPDWSPHLIAYFVKQRYGVKWVADYRDPWVANRDYIQLYYPWMTEEEVVVDQQLEKKLTEKMDRIILAGGKWTEDFVENYGVEPSKIKEITNGFDEDDFRNIEVKFEKNKKFTLCYNGGIAHNRNPLMVMKALNLLIDEGEVGEDEVQWIFNGWISEDYLIQMYKEDKYHIAVINDVLPHKESIKIAMQSDLMVMYGESGEKGYLNYPGKFYEYLRIGKPILCFSSSQSFQAEILQETRLGVNLDLDDIEGINHFLRQQIAVWKTEKKLDIDTRETIQKYERKNLTRILAKEFDHVLGL